MKRNLLFIDRDGTLIAEPPVTFQVDHLSQLQLLPGVIRNLYRIGKELDYDFVMVTNQDGLGTESYAQSAFDIVQNKMMELFANEDIHFLSVHIDKSFPHENLATRKPGTGMLTAYMNGDFDLANAYVIGDRITDIQLAQNLGAQAIFLKNFDSAEGWEDKVSLTANSWDDIYQYLKAQRQRTAVVQRKTAETDIRIQLNLDGAGRYNIDTGLHFLNHMLEQLSKHSGLDLDIVTKGDLHIDEHHTIEDTAIALGAAFSEALGDKRGIGRYGFCLPMDDCLAQVALDFGGRSWLEWDVIFHRERVGDVPTEMFCHFFKSFCDGARCNLNIKAEGTNEHHKIESVFKALARAVKMAVQKDAHNQSLPSTKGIL